MKLFETLTLPTAVKVKFLISSVINCSIISCNFVLLIVEKLHSNLCVLLSPIFCAFSNDFSVVVVLVLEYRVVA